MNLALDLLAWYDENARDLPWRRTEDPYHILVSEFMLQQTQVQTVIPYYDRFLNRFPTVTDLAKCSIDDVLVVWKGLGYYRRAHHLHQSARVIVERHAGRVPRTYEDVRALPGVGDYTAAAVLSIAFDRPYPVLDGNVARVVSRLQCLDEPVDRTKTKRRMMAYLDESISHDRPGDFNQAMMELGATICLPREPNCSYCPVFSMCKAQKEGRQSELPMKSVRVRTRTETRTVVVARWDERVFLARRADGGLLARMWEFPHNIGKGEEVVYQILQGIASDTNPAAWRIRRIGPAEHRFSHLVWQFDVVEAVYDGLARGVGESVEYAAFGWLTPREVDRTALPRAMQKVWELARAQAKI